MSNYVYNDNFSNDSNINKEPIQIYFKDGKSTVSKKLIALFSALALLISTMLGVLIGVLINDTDSSGARNEVYTNTLYVSDSDSVLTLSQLDSATRADIVASISDSVVEIQTQYTVHSFYQYVTSGAGSGVIVGEYETEDSSGYYVITNAHVIEGSSSYEIAESITVILTDGTEYEATVVGSDSVSDIAVLRIEETERELNIATFAGEDTPLRVGDDVIAIGNPLGELGGTVTNGYISALDREIQIDGVTMNLLQTDAAINPGNSGGGLFNLNGELIGIVNAKSSGSDIEGLGFAIPADDARLVLEDLINYGYVTNRPTVGITCATNRYGYVQVVSLLEGYNDSVLQIGDIIYMVEVDGEFAQVNISALQAIVNELEIGDTLNMKVYRNGEELDVTITVYEYTR